MTPDGDKTKAELIKEIGTLCKHLAKLGPKQVRLKASESRRCLTVEGATAKQNIRAFIVKRRYRL